MLKTGAIVYENRTSDLVTHVAWSPDGQHIATGDGTGSLQVCYANTGQRVFASQVHTYPISALLWSPTGMTLISGDTAGFVVVWEVQTGRARYIYHYPEYSDTGELGGSQTQIACSPDGLFLASSGCVGTERVIEIWDTLTGEKKAVWQRERSVAALRWSPDGHYLAVGDTRGMVRLRTPLTGKLVRSYHRPPVIPRQGMIRITSMAWSSDSKYLAFGDSLGLVHLWNSEKRQSPSIVYAQELHSIEEIQPWSSRKIAGVAWLPGTYYLASAYRAVQVHHAASGRLKDTYLNPFEEQRSTASDPMQKPYYILHQVDWSPDRRLVVFVGGYTRLVGEKVHCEGFIRVWKLGEEEMAQRYHEEFF